MYICTYTHIHIYIYMDMNVCIHIHGYTYTWILMCVFAMSGVGGLQVLECCWCIHERRASFAAVVYVGRKKEDICVLLYISM